MTVAAASCWSYPAKLSTTRAWMIDHCAGALLHKDRNGWVRHHRDISAYLNPSGAGGVAPPVQESHVTRLSKKSLWTDTLTALMTRAVILHTVIIPQRRSLNDAI
jgi:hypothetical protein